MQEIPEQASTGQLENPERRAFTLQSILALLSGVTISITASGCDESPTAPSPSPGASDITGSVSANHGHSAIIMAAQLSAGNSVTLQIRGTATHPHTVELTASDVQQIAARQRVSKDVPSVLCGSGSWRH